MRELITSQKIDVEFSLLKLIVTHKHSMKVAYYLFRWLNRWDEESREIDFFWNLDYMVKSFILWSKDLTS